MSKEAMKLALGKIKSARDCHPNAVDTLLFESEEILEKALAEQPAQQALDKMAENARELGLDYEPAQPKYRRGDRLICLETEEYCVIHISGTDRQWVKFPDTHIGVYKNEQLAELFELLPKEIEIEQPAQQQGPVGEITAEDMGRPFNAIRIGTHFYKEVPPVGTKLYTSPPAQRTWVGLSDEEKRQLFDREDYQGWLDYINAIEAKLKEKNT